MYNYYIDIVICLHDKGRLARDERVLDGGPLAEQVAGPRLLVFVVGVGDVLSGTCVCYH